MIDNAKDTPEMLPRPMMTINDLSSATGDDELSVTFIVSKRPVPLPGCSTKNKNSSGFMNTTIGIVMQIIYL